MRIALISYEYAGVSGGGGIGTYVRNAAAMLSDAGHLVHVFTGGEQWREETPKSNLTISTVAASREGFAGRVVDRFRVTHAINPFDVIEGPEYGCDARVVAEEFPELPLVVRLHGPSFSIHNSNVHYIGWKNRWRFRLGALRRGRWPGDPWTFPPETDPERLHAITADEIVANSQATAAYATAFWKLDQTRLSVVPYAFVPPARLSALETNPQSRVILFVGKLEVRKGVLELARAIPAVVRRHPDAIFRLVGRDLPHPADGRPISMHIRELAGPAAANIEIPGPVPYDEIPEEFSRASICVFPSDWEASGFVCYEGMAAARAVIGSSAGGMAEIITDGENGLLVPHRDPTSIAEAINRLLSSSETCLALGRAARERIATAFAPDRILPMQMAAYERAIARARQRDPARRFVF